MVSSFFADIFKNNSLNNGLLPVVVSDKYLKNLLETIKKNPDTKVRVDLPNQEFSILPDGEPVKFDINPYKKECLMKGLDDIDYLMSIKNEIEEFEAKRK